ncbi:MAG TPA: hypothetical protein VK934_05025 [Fimbriimonas sp.]|nr:hypothetical protein [Fimbriimonas sp.]
MSKESSLDRFLKNRAALGLGLVDRRITGVQSVIGAMLCAFGIATIVATNAAGNPQAASAGLPLFMAGAFMFGFSQLIRRRFRSLNQTEWRLTSEAKGLLLKLVRKRLGWLDGGSFSMAPMIGFSGGPHARRRLRHLAWETGEPGFGFFNRAPTEIGPEVIELLDVAAEQYNRIAGLVHSPAPRSAIAKLASSATAAADEAMADILHETATLDKYPESASATRKHIESAIHGLIELADRLEDVATRDQSLTEKVDYSSKMDSVLEELRLEQLARSELSESPQPDIQQRQSS